MLHSSVCVWELMWGNERERKKGTDCKIGEKRKERKRKRKAVRREREGGVEKKRKNAIAKKKWR